MPIDYSKFDSIEDSDEEKPAPKPLFQPPARQDVLAPRSAAGAPAAKAPAAVSRSGRPLLEPAGLDQKLKFAQPEEPSEMEMLASQFQKLAGPGGAEALATPTPEPTQNPHEPKRLCMRSEGKKKIHTTFPDGAEMVEEYDEKTDMLLLRKVRKSAVLGKENEWVFEVGQPPEAAFDPHADLMKASSNNPIFMRKDTPESFQWRIRNLAYPSDVYSVTVDHEKQEVVVRTSNKKYYKRFGIPDLARLGLKLQDASLSWKHQHNTLIISYLRPVEVLEQEQKLLREANKSAVKV